MYCVFEYSIYIFLVVFIYNIYIDVINSKNIEKINNLLYSIAIALQGT